MAKRPNNIVHTYALIGAQSRLETLQAEVASILRAFPELNGGRRTSNTSVPASSNDGQATRRRPKMSAAQRKAVGQRMAKYWAKRRREKKAGTSATAKAAKTATATV